MLAAVLALRAAEACGFVDGAPPAHTGGFGEPDCSACHSDGEKNAPKGELDVEGLPASYVPGHSYRLAIVLRHPELASGGFQLALRTAAGAVAGELIPASERTQIVTEAGQAYLQHTRKGAQADIEGSICWAFEWQAPETAEPLVLNLAANAANDDISELGDYIYTLEQTLQPAAGARHTGDTASTVAVARETCSYDGSVTGSRRKR